MLHNHQGKLYRFTIFVVLFILLASMAPAQPALAHPSLGGAIPAPAADYYPDPYEPDNSRDRAKKIEKYWGVFLAPPHSIHSFYPVNDVDWGYFDVSTAGSYVVVTLDYFGCYNTCPNWWADPNNKNPANFTIYMPNGMTGDGRKIYPNLVGGVPTTPVNYVFTICNARPGRYYTESFGEWGPVYGYIVDVQITSPWNGVGIPYSLPTSGCDYNYPSLIHR